MKQVDDLPRVSIVFSQKLDGDLRSGAWVSRWLKQVGFTEKRLAHLQLVHGSDVALITQETPTTVVADSAVTSKAFGGLSLVVGDCIPVVLIDTESDVLALVHGGWRSLAADIIQKTIKKMIERGAKVERLWVWIGPGVRPCCYESIQKPLQIDEQDWCSSITQTSVFEQEKKDSKNMWKIDLPGYIFSVVKKLGVPQKQVIDEGTCTCCHPNEFFSHLRSKKTGEAEGRFAVVALWK